MTAIGTNGVPDFWRDRPIGPLVLDGDNGNDVPAGVESTPSVLTVETVLVEVSVLVDGGDNDSDVGTVETGAEGGVTYHCCTPAEPSARFGTFSTGVPNCSTVPTARVKRDGDAAAIVSRYSPGCAGSCNSNNRT
jgi:hypothetical protein